VGVAGGYALLQGSRGDAASPADAVPFTYAELTGSIFLPAAANPLAPPVVRELGLPPMHGANAIWGATGRGPRGRIWIGVSAASAGASARLLEYEPLAGAWHERGAVVERLKAAGLHREGESQVKIHSKIVPGADGWLYFASTDEAGEVAGTVPPRWGGHLWRIHPETYGWEHLLAVPEGLVALSGVGRYVFALGYWGHVLYVYDTRTGETKRTVVGSVGGHVSRNFLADIRGHAYVPRVTAGSGGHVTAALVEYDSALRELAATPLEFYLGSGSPNANHGIVGLAYLPDGRLLFTTHRGHLYAIDPRGAGAAAVSALGWLHREGEAYAPSLFFLGGSLVAGVTQRGGRYDWAVFELKTRTAVATPIDTKGLQGVLLYGSISRDNAGRFYVVGWAANPTGGYRPLVLQVESSPESTR